MKKTITFLLVVVLILGMTACTSQATSSTSNANEFESDLVVIGAGGGGMMSALQATKADVDVIILEKGASSAASNTHFVGGTTAVNSQAQKDAGIKATIDEVFNHMMTYSQGTVNQSLVRRCLESSGEMMNTMVDLGIKVFIGPDRYNVGFETVHVYETSNKMEFLEKEITAKGGRFMYDTSGTELIMKDGAIAGVKAKKSDGTEIIINCKSVVVATGGFLNNKEMMDTYFGDAEQVAVAGSSLCTGDGIQMAEAAGAIMDTNFALSTYADVAGYNTKNEGILGTYLSDKRNQAFVFGNIGSVLVDNKGERFINEYLLANNPLAFGGAIQTRVGYYYAIVDQKTIDELAKESPYTRLDRPKSWNVGPILFDTPQDRIHEDIQTAIDEGWAWKGESIEELAKVVGLENLSKELENYNKMCKDGVDNELGLPKTFLKAVENGPYYAFEYQPAGLVTMGGIKTDSTCNALNNKNEPIPGLYVAGSDNGSVYSGPYYDVGGTSSGLALSTGWIAGKESANYLKE